MAFQPQVTGKELWVDSVYGDDATAKRNRPDLPFATIAAAITASNPGGVLGDSILVHPGNYPEEGLVLNQLSLIGLGDWEHTVLGPPPASSSADTITLEDGGFIKGFSLNVPRTAFNAINANQVSGTNSIYDVAFYGDGGSGTSAGTGILRSGGGKTIGANIRVEEGGILNCFKNDDGVLALEGIHVPESGGSIQNVLYVTTDVASPNATKAGRAQFLGFNTGNTNVVNAIRVDSGNRDPVNPLNPDVVPTCLVFTANIFNCTNAVSSGGDYMNVNLVGGRIENVTYAVNVDLTANGDEANYIITANHQPQFLYTPTVALNSNFELSFLQQRTDTTDAALNQFGMKALNVGFLERGTELFVGKGGPSSVGTKVYTTDSTAYPSSMPTAGGNNLTDISSTVADKSTSFTFQGSTAGHTIVFCTQRQDGSGPIKTWGLDAEILLETNGGEYIVERWDGSNWIETKIHSTNKENGVSYGDTLFLRRNVEEIIRFGIFDSSLWAQSTIDGILGYWTRIRIVTAPAALPDFTRWRLLANAFKVSKNGVPSYTGLALLDKTIPITGPVWTSDSSTGSGALGQLVSTVGSAPTQYDHKTDNSLANTANDLFMIQVPLPIGICTAYPISLRMSYEIQGAAGNISASPNQITTDIHPAKVSGVSIADPAGGLVPVPRPSTTAIDLDAIVGTQRTVDLIPTGKVVGDAYADVLNQIHKVTLIENIDISELYETDVLIIKLDVSQIDGGADIGLWSLTLDGVFYTEGTGIENL